MVNLSFIKKTAPVAPAVGEYELQALYSLDSVLGDYTQGNLLSLPSIKNSKKNHKNLQQVLRVELQEAYLKEEAIKCKNMQMIEELEEIEIKKKELDEENEKLQMMLENLYLKDEDETKHKEALEQQLRNSAKWNQRLTEKNCELVQKRLNAGFEMNKQVKEKKKLEKEIEKLDRQLEEEDIISHSLDKDLKESLKILENFHNQNSSIKKISSEYSKGSRARHCSAQNLRQKSWLRSFCGNSK